MEKGVRIFAIDSQLSILTDLFESEQNYGEDVRIVKWH